MAKVYIDKPRNNVHGGEVLHIQPPKNPADYDRFFDDVERACKDIDDSVQTFVIDTLFHAFNRES